MLLAFFAVLFVGASGRDLIELKFRVLTPNELMVEVPNYEGMDLVTFRVGVRRKDSELEDLELGESVMNNNRIFIYNERLNLKRGDVVNYLLAFKDKEGYQARTGKYVFDGVYFKKPFTSHRYQRKVTIPTTVKADYNFDDTEEFEPEPRFGGGPRHHNPGFNPFRPPGPGGPHGGPPQFFPGHGPRFHPEFPFPGPNPGFGRDCNDHRHDLCHNVDTERMRQTTEQPSFKNHDGGYHCRMCSLLTTSASTSKPVTSTEYPQIDVRMSDD